MKTRPDGVRRGGSDGSTRDEFGGTRREDGLCSSFVPHIHASGIERCLAQLLLFFFLLSPQPMHEFFCPLHTRWLKFSPRHSPATEARHLPTVTGAVCADNPKLKVERLVVR